MYGNEAIADRIENGKRDLAYAEKLTRDGTDQEDVFELTGWFQGPDGEFRTRLSDESFELTGALEEKGTTTLQDAVHHDDLFEIMPEIANTQITHDPSLPYAGAFDPSTGNITVQDANDAPVIAHEIMHDIQDEFDAPIESRGANPAVVGMDGYLNNNGEIEADDVMENIGKAPDEDDLPDLLEKRQEQGLGAPSPYASAEGGELGMAMSDEGGEGMSPYRDQGLYQANFADRGETPGYGTADDGGPESWSEHSPPCSLQAAFEHLARHGNGNGEIISYENAGGGMTSTSIARMTDGTVRPNTSLNEREQATLDQWNQSPAIETDHNGLQAFSGAPDAGTCAPSIGMD